MRNVKKTFDLSRYNITRVKNLLEKYTIIAYFYISLNSELIRYSQFYDISVSNELNVQRSRTEYLMCYPSESLQSDHLHESLRARKLVRNATLLSLISSKPDDTKARRREISHSENSRRKERENDRNEKRAPSLTA